MIYYHLRLDLWSTQITWYHHVLHNMRLDGPSPHSIQLECSVVQFFPFKRCSTQGYWITDQILNQVNSVFISSSLSWVSNKNLVLHLSRYQG